MKETGTYDLVFKELEESKDFVIYIDYIEKIDEDNSIQYNCLNSTIYWSPNAFAKNKNGTYAFPATILAHEGAHALQHLKYGTDEYIKRQGIKVDKYKNMNEEEVIKGIEQVVARKHGDIREDEVTRKDHYGLPYIIPEITACPLLETCIIPEKNREDFNVILNSVIWELILKYYSTQQSH